MGDRGDVHYAPSAQLTEWDGILINKGIVQKDDVLRAKGIDPDELRLKEAISKARDEECERWKSRTMEDKLAEKELGELDELEDEFGDEEEEAILQRIRQARLQEMKETSARERFGEVLEISKSDWVVEVTEGSKQGWVVAHLYEDGVTECRVMEGALHTLARKFKALKFVKIRSKQAVENWPESNLPTLFCYNNGALAKQLIGSHGLGGKQMKPDDLEWWLASQGILETELEANPRSTARANVMGLKVQRGRGGSDDEAGDEDDSI
ncbi:unnamed protein product [Chrysoparadoxa australica]